MYRSFTQDRWKRTEIFRFNLELARVLGSCSRGPRLNRLMMKSICPSTSWVAGDEEVLCLSKWCDLPGYKQKKYCSRVITRKIASGSYFVLGILDPGNCYILISPGNFDWEAMLYWDKCREIFWTLESLLTSKLSNHELAIDHLRPFTSFGWSGPS